MSYLSTHSYKKSHFIFLILTGFLILSSCSTPPRIRQLKKKTSRKHYFDWPVDRARLTQKFKLYSHLGIDLAFKTGTPIYAAHDGIVIYANSGFSGFGKLIIIEGENNNLATFYGHLNKIRVQQGQRVSQGNRIGDMGSTGRSSGTHLHFEIRKNKRSQDPLKYLP